MVILNLRLSLAIIKTKTIEALKIRTRRSMKRHQGYILALLLIFPTRVMTRSSSGVPEGWKMTDRFIGFRYELHPTAIEGDDLKAALRGEANSF